MLSLHDTKIDPREKFVLEMVSSTGQYEVLFVGIGEGNNTQEGLNAINLPEEGTGYKELLKNVAFAIKYRKEIASELVFLTFILFPFAFTLRLAITLFSLLSQISNSKTILNAAFKRKKNYDIHPINSRNDLLGNVLSFYPKLKSRLVDNKNFGCLIRLTWNVHFHLLRKNAILIRYVQQNLDQIDVLHANDFDTLIAASIIKNKYNSRIIYDSQEFFPDSNSVFSSLEKRIYSNVDRKYCLGVNAVVTVTPQLGLHMKNLYGLNRVFVIPNAYKLETRTHQSRRGAEKHKTKFIFQGNFSLNRGLEILITVWKSQILNDVAELYLVGPNSRHKEKLVHLAINLDIFNKGVYFPEAVDPDKLVENLISFDVGIIPYPPIDHNFKFCCPNKLGQYMAAGIAVMSNQLPFVNSLVDMAGCGYSYAFNDEKSILDTIIRFCDSEVLSRLQHESRTFYEEIYNWERIGQRFIRIYQNSEIEMLESDAGPLAFIV